MRWIKKEFDEDGNPEWAVYIDEAGEGREDDELYQAGIAFNALLRVWAWIKGYTPPGMKL